MFLYEFIQQIMISINTSLYISILNYIKIVWEILSICFVSIFECLVL